MKNKIIKECLSLIKEEMKHRVYPKSDGRSKHWTAIVHKRHGIIGWGSNSKKTHPIAYKYGHRFDNIHSELASYISMDSCYKNYEILRKNCYMLNLRMNRFFELRNSLPCPNCQKFIMTTGIKHVYYSTNDKIASDNVLVF